MFTGIIESMGSIDAIAENGSNKVFWIQSTISDMLKIDQSVAHNGVCLTVDATRPGAHRVTAIAETLAKTNLNAWKNGSLVNLERCLQLNGRLDGHIVQGHVDTTALCTAITEKNGSVEFDFEIDKKYSSLIIEKGSISLNGISLTLFNVRHNAFTVAIIPYTLEHTNCKQLQLHDSVNVEFDMIGKYVNRIQLLSI